MYQKPPEPCREPFTPCWCESRPNNPHCTDALPIDNTFLITASTILIIIYTFYIMKTHSYLIKQELGMKHITINGVKYVPEFKKLSLFDKVSTFLWGEKPFRWGELKGL